MENDERITTAKREAESIGYRLLFWSLLGVFVFYSIILRQPSSEILVVLIIWLIFFVVLSLFFIWYFIYRYWEKKTL